MKIAIITDTHYGARKGSKHLHDYFEKFYDDVFFPTLEAEGIDTVIHMGDAFDSRKSIDYQSLEWSKRVVFDRLKNYDVHMIIGNHDCYYKNTNNVNSPELLLQTYNNIKTYSEVSEITLDKLKILFIPWINAENFENTVKSIKNTSSICAMGHLELNGFRAHRGHVMEDGMDCKLFDKFEKVFSGHYHTRSDNGKIFYLGNPYEMFWNDVNDKRGFHIFDTETLTHTPVNNPYKLFYNIYYEDTPYQMFDASEYENKIVKVIVRKKSNPKSFEKFIDKLYVSGIQDLKIVENFEIHEGEDFQIDEDENTLSILNRYIEEAEMNFDKNIIKNIFQDLYRKACEVE
jgi:DNA repair exonuclease SbcCD nuclease subunit|tara:strand:+ start:69 stop:1103 length:1035 start_codon:yes stop_codon:yes gene_type:complete